MKAKLKPFVGKWIIAEMEAWDQEFVNMEAPGHFTFRKDGTGHFQFGLVQGEMDCRLKTPPENRGSSFHGKGRMSWIPRSGGDGHR